MLGLLSACAGTAFPCGIRFSAVVLVSCFFWYAVSFGGLWGAVGRSFSRLLRMFFAGTADPRGMAGDAVPDGVEPFSPRQFLRRFPAELMRLFVQFIIFC